VNQSVGAATGEVILDLEMLATLFSGLTEDPDLFHMLQFVTLAEAAVLRNKLIIVDVHDDDDDAEERRSSKLLVESYILPLIDSGAAVIEGLKLPRRASPPRASVDKSGPGITIAAEDDVFARVVLMAGHSLSAERLRNQPSVTLPMQQSVYEMSANVRADHSVCDLSGHYRSLAKALADLRQHARVDPVEYDVVPLPPIGLEVFRAASDIDQLPMAVMDVRDHYSDLRARLGELKVILDDPSVSLQRKLKLRAKWSDSWKKLGSQFDFSGALGLANTNSAIYKLAPEVPGAMALSPSAWIHLLTTVLEQGSELWSRWRLRTLHRSLRNYVKAPDRALGGSVERIIRRSVTADEIRDVREVDATMVQLGRAAVAIFYDDTTAPAAEVGED
jgi:hypothetical protein